MIAFGYIPKPKQPAPEVEPKPKSLPAVADSAELARVHQGLGRR